MTPVNITINIEETAKRRGLHGSVVFAQKATNNDAVEALHRNGIQHTTLPHGFTRKLFQIIEHLGGKHFEFFISDELEPPAQEAAP